MTNSELGHYNLSFGNQAYLEVNLNPDGLGKRENA